MITKNTKIVASLSIAFFVVCSIAGYFFIKKVYAEKAAYTNSVYQHALMLEREKSLDARIQALADTKDERASLTSRILKDEEIIDFLELIETLGREQRVKIGKSGLKVESIDATFESVVMGIEIVGTYAQVAHMINIFEHLPYQVAFANIALSKISIEQDGVWKATFEMRATKFKKV